MYKKDKSKDVTFDFFKQNDFTKQIDTSRKNKLDFSEWYQFEDYTKVLDFKSLVPIFLNYFTPSDRVLQVMKSIQSKYNINTDNSIGVYFRGTDKKTETAIPPFEMFYDKIEQVFKNNFQNPENQQNQENTLKIILQTDTAQFMDFVKQNDARIPLSNFIVINENPTSYSSKGIHNEKTAQENYEEMFYLFATFLILSQSKYFITSSGNCSFTMMLYRGHGNNVFQILNDKWLS